MVGTGMVSTTRREIPSYPPLWHTACHCKRKTPSLEQVWVEPRAVRKELSEIWKQKSNKPEHVQRVFKGWVPNSATKDMWDRQPLFTRVVFVFTFQAFSIYLKSAQYTARSIKWKSQTKSFEAFLSLFWFIAMNNVINGHVCCIFNSLNKQNMHNMQFGNDFYLIQPSW